MASADEIERIVIEIEQQGADKTYVSISRTNDALKSLAGQKGPESLAKSFDDLAAAAARANAATDKVGPVRDDRGRFLPRGSAPSKGVDGGDLPMPSPEAEYQTSAKDWQRDVANLRRYNESQVRKAMRNTDMEMARQDAQQLASRMRASNFVPTHLQSGANPKTIDYAAALASQSQKAGSAIEAAAHGAMEEAIAIGQAAQAASKLSSVYDVIEKRAKAAAKADKDHLADQMRAANRIPTHLQSASGPKALTGGQKAFQSFSRTFGPKATQNLVSTVETMEKIGPIASKMGPPLATAAVAIGAITVAGAGAAIWAGKEFGGAVIGAQAFREDMVTALESIAGTEKKANSIIDRASRTASFLGKKKGETVGSFTSLMGKGFDVDMTDNLVRKMADLRVKAPKTNLDSMVLALGQINSKGKLAAEELGQLTEAGLNKKDFMGILSGQTGKSIAEMEKALSTGKVSSEQFFKAFLATDSKGKGPLGTLAHDKSRKDFSSLIEQVKSIPDDIFFDVKAGPGMEGVKSTLNSILDWFDMGKGKGKEVRQVTGDLFNTMIEGLTGNKIDTKKGITGTLDAILDGAKKAEPTVRMFSEAIHDAVAVAGLVVTNLDTIGSGFENVGMAWKGMSFPVRMMTAPLLGPLALLPELYQGYKGIRSLLSGDMSGAKTHFMSMLPGGDLLMKYQTQIDGFFDSMVSGIASKASGILSAGVTYGQNLWQGIAQGITGGIGAVVQSATDLANAALSAVGSTWRVGSPARAFEDYSLFAGAGTVRGFKRSESDVWSAAASMANAGLGGAWAAGQANGNGGAGITAMPSSGGAAGVVINFSPTIIVSGANSPAQAQAIGAAAVQGARAQFEASMSTGLRRLRYG